MDWSSFQLFFKCFLLSSTVTSNFRNSPRCYHDDSSKCREGYCGVTRSMLAAEIQCRLMTVKTLTNLTKSQMKSGSEIIIEQDFPYLSESAYCYPYLNLTWKVQPELLRITSYFYLSISYVYLGEMKVLNKLMNVSSKGNPDKYVRFFFSCHQIAYPGVSYQASVSALNENQELLSFSNTKTSAPCQIKFSKNPARIQPGPKLKDEWIPNQRILLDFGRVEIFFTMPDCWINIWSLILQLNHTSHKEVFSLKKFRCTCSFNGSATFDNLPAGNYTLTFLTLTTTSTIGKKILQLEMVLPRGVKVEAPETSANLNRSGTTASSEVRSNMESSFEAKESETEDWKLKMWFVVGVTILILWVVTSSLFCYRVKTSRQEFSFCLRGTLNAVFKGAKNVKSNSRIEAKQTKAAQWSDKFDSGIGSKCSNFDSIHADRSDGYVNTSLERCCACNEHCPECSAFCFDFQLKFHPPSDDIGSVNSGEFRETINSLNLESNQL